MTAIAPTLQAFFVSRLGRQRDASPNTVDSYRHAFRLLLAYAEAQTGKRPSQLDLADLDAGLVSGFLDHLEADRANSVASRNTRLAAVHSFFRFASYRHPEHAETIQQVLAIPRKRTERVPRSFLTSAEMDAVASAPDLTTWSGRRDHVLLVVALQTGLRLSELTGLRCRDVDLGVAAHVKCLGKGRKRRDTPLDKPTVKLLRAWMFERRGEADDALFPSRRGGRLSPDAVQRLVAKHVATARNVCPSLANKPVSTHNLRHSCAMDLLRNGLDVAVLALWLGHEKTRVRQRLHPSRPHPQTASGRTSDPTQPDRQTGTLQTLRRPPRLLGTPLKMPRSTAARRADHPVEHEPDSTPRPLRGITGSAALKDSISIGILAPEDESPEVEKIFHDEASVRRFVARFADPRRLVACYEAGPTGYELYRLLISLGVSCQVIAPSLIPRSAADRVKTDRRDCRKLARLHRAGQLVAIRVPSRHEEAVRDLCRARADMVEDLDRARKRLGAFLLRHSQVWRGGSAWTIKHHQWLAARRFDDAAMAATFAHYRTVVDARERELAAAGADLAVWYDRDPFAEPVRRLCVYRGVAQLGALTLASEICDWRRFGRASAFMGFTGLVPSEYSSGGKTSRGHITKAGNWHMRTQLIESAWAYQSGPSVGVELRKRHDGVDAETLKRAWAAQVRLCARFRRLAARKNSKNVVATAVARELCGFLWAEMTA